MNNSFAGWDEVARHLMEMALPASPSASLLNDGQRASLGAIAARIASNGIVIADEVGMGKTRIAAHVANAVARSGGRCAVLIPPGLGFQWQAEFRACGSDVPQVIRSLQGYYEAWDKAENDAKTIAPWFKQPIVMVSHRFSDWRLGQNPHPWRWWLLPEVYAAARQLTDGRLPRSYHGANDYTDDARVQRVIAAAWSMTQNAHAAVAIRRAAFSKNSCRTCAGRSLFNLNDTDATMRFANGWKTSWASDWEFLT